MAIIDVVRVNGEDAPKRTGVRIGWFIVIWSISTGAFFAAASLLHLLIPK